MTKQAPFRVLTPEEIRERPHKRRRAWGHILAELDAGQHVYVDTKHVTDADVKYLRLVYIRRGGTARLRAHRVGATGRELWLGEAGDED